MSKERGRDLAGNGVLKDSPAPLVCLQIITCGDLASSVSPTPPLWTGAKRYSPDCRREVFSETRALDANLPDIRPRVFRFSWLADIVEV